MLHAGDVAYGVASGEGGATHQTLNDWFFSIYANTLRSRAVFPSIGNHDSRASNSDGRPYLDMFVLPTNGGGGAYPDHAERYYSFDYGPVHVVVLDTELAFQDANRRAAQLAWLEADLGSTAQPWKVALFHRSPFSAGGEHGSDLVVRAAFAPVFERHGVQVAISAHEHDYERTQPVKIGTDPAGTPVTYIVTGGGGGPLYPAGTDTWTAVSASRHHFIRGSATTCTLTVDAIGTDSTTFDTVTLSRCEPVPDTQDPTASITAPSPGGDGPGQRHGDRDRRRQRRRHPRRVVRRRQPGCPGHDGALRLHVVVGVGHQRQPQFDGACVRCGRKRRRLRDRPGHGEQPDGRRGRHRALRGRRDGDPASRGRGRTTARQRAAP